MTTENRKIQLGATVNTTEARAGFSEIKAAAQDMAAGVKAAGQDAAKGTDAIGPAGEQAAQKVDRATKNIIGSVQRQTAALEAGGRGTAQYFETIAKQRGLNVEALRPYLTQLDEVAQRQKAAQVATQAFAPALRNVGDEARQTAIQMRQVAPQITDIVTSLAGGQAPLQVLIQQGGQLKDVFGGVGPALGAMTRYLVGLVNPITVIAAAVGVLGYAYSQGSKEVDGYNNALILSGNAAGATSSRLQIMAKDIAAVTGTQGQAAAAIAEVAQSGSVAADRLQRYTLAAVQFEKTTSTSVAKTVEAFRDLAKAPLEATLKLNESMNYLQATTLRQIQALEEQGRKTEAARVAQDAYADTLQQRSAQITQNLGYIESGWNKITAAIKGAGDALLDIGRAPTLQEQIASLRGDISARNGNDPNRRFALPWEESTESMRQRLSFLTEQERMQNRAAERRTEETAAVKLLAEFQKDGAKYLTDQQKQKAAITAETARNNELVRAGLITEKEAADRLQAVRASFAKKGPEIKTDAFQSELARRYTDAMRDLAKIEGDAEAKTEGLTKAQARLREEMASPVWAQYNRQKQEQIIMAAAAAIEAEDEAAARKRAADVAKEAAQSYKQYTTALERGVTAVQEQVQKLEDEERAAAVAATANISLAEAIERVTIERLRERQVAALGNEDLVLALQREIDLRTQLAGQIGRKEARDESLKASVQDLKEVDQAAREVFREVGQNGVDAFKRIGKTIQTSVLDVLYQVTARPFIIQLAASLTGAPASAVQQLLGGSGGLLAQGGQALGLTNLLPGMSSITGFAQQALGAVGLGNVGAGLAGVGGSFSSSVGAGLATDALGATVAEGAAAATLGAGSTIGAAIPYVGAALVAAQALGLFDSKGGPKTMGGVSEAATIQSAVAATLSTFGVSAASFRVGGFSAADPAGDSLTQVQAALFQGDRALYSRQDRVGNYEDVGRSQEELAAAWAEEQSRIMLAALQATLDPKYQQYIAGLDVNGSTVDAINAGLARLSTARVLEERLLELSSTEAENLARARQRDVDAMDETLRPLVLQIQAQEDLKKRLEETNAALLSNVKQDYDAVLEARREEGDELRTTVSRLRDYSRSLREFRDGLLLGSLSTLTPGQRLEEARRQLDATAAAARGGDADAQAQVQSLVSAFLEASATYNASGPGFTSDFAYAQQLLTDLSTNAQAGADVAQLQLTALGQLNASVLTIPEALDRLSVSVMAAINGGLDPGAAAIAALANGAYGRVVSSGAGNVYADAGGAAALNQTVYTKDGKTYAQQALRDEIIAAINSGATGADFAASSARTGLSRSSVLELLKGTGYESLLPAFANGGDHTGGWAKVGERGVELAYMPPARIYSNADTRKILDIQPLQAEVQQLRGTVEQLGQALVAATYDATSQAASQTVQGVAGATSRAMFVQQNQPVVA